MMLRTVPAGRPVLRRALLMALIGASAILGLVGMHAFHPESHLVPHSSPPALVTDARHDLVPIDPIRTALAGGTHHDDDPPGGAARGATQHGDAESGFLGCGDCGMDGGHVMVMVLCLLTLLASAAVTLWPPGRQPLRPALSVRVLYQQLAARWPSTVAPSRPPSLQLLAISRT